MCKRSVQNSLRQLQDMGLIQIEKPAQLETRRPTTYQFNLEKLHILAKEQGNQVGKLAHEMPIPSASCAREEVHDVQAPGAYPAPEPSLNHPIEPTEEHTGEMTSLPAPQAFDLYNTFAARNGWPVADRLTKRLIDHLHNRLKDLSGLDGWQKYLERVEHSSFLCGVNPRDWVVDLDFLLTESGCIKICEGSYDDRPARQRRAPRYLTDEDIARNVAKGLGLTGQQVTEFFGKPFDDAE